MFFGDGKHATLELTGPLNEAVLTQAEVRLTPVCNRHGYRDA